MVPSPSATDSLTGYYLIVRVPGDQITVTPGESRERLVHLPGCRRRLAKV